LNAGIFALPAYGIRSITQVLLSAMMRPRYEKAGNFLTFDMKWLECSLGPDGEKHSNVATQMEVLDANQDRAHLPHLCQGASDYVLRVSDLTIRYFADSLHEAKVVRNVSFSITPGKIVGLLGESGCGKTTTALAMMRMLPPSMRVSAGSLEFCGESLLELS